MFDGLKVAVVIPAYRVANEIGSVLERIPAGVDRVFVVDDHSPDDLVSIVANWPDSRVTLLRHEKNRGVGGATVTGVAAALEAGIDIVVKCDGDAQIDPGEIPLLLEPILGGWADHAKGSRFHHSGELRTMPRWRLFGNIGLTFLTKMASGYWHILDPVNGFFASRSEVLRSIPLQRLSRRYFFESDLLIRLNIVEARVADVALPARYGQESSSLSVPRALFDFPPRLFAGLLRRIFWRYLFYDVSPVAVFFALGVLLSGFGFVFGIYQWVWHASRNVATPLGTVMIATLPLIFGFQLLLQAMVLDIGATPKPGRRDSDRRHLFSAPR
jgi:glycosyltransferase involved in cell wall biosynthesis